MTRCRWGAVVGGLLLLGSATGCLSRSLTVQNELREELLVIAIVPGQNNFLTMGFGPVPRRADTFYERIGAGEKLTMRPPGDPRGRWRRDMWPSVAYRRQLEKCWQFAQLPEGTRRARISEDTETGATTVRAYRIGSSLQITPESDLPKAMIEYEMGLFRAEYFEEVAPEGGN